MKPHSVKYHTCPRCKKQAIVLVTLKSDTQFYRDNMNNIQYQCISCYTTFSVDDSQKIVAVRPGRSA